MDFKFIHAADIHLDSPLRGLGKYSDAPIETIRLATREALKNLVELAIDEEVQFVLIAGDLYDRDWKDSHTGLFFNHQMLRLKEYGIRVFIVAGNHDAIDNQITRQLLALGNVHFLSERKPESVRLEDLRVMIHGQSFKNASVQEDLSSRYPTATVGYFNIGLLHTSATGFSEHATYAPCSLDGLKSRGYDYWALGHVHKRVKLSEKPLIAFPGCIQGRHIRETGEKGCLLTSVEDGVIVSHEFIPLDVLRWEMLEVDCSEARFVDDIPLIVAREAQEHLPVDERLVGMRIRLTGASSILKGLNPYSEDWKYNIRVKLLDECNGRVWIEKILLHPSAHPDQPMSAPETDLLSRLIEDIRPDGEQIRQILDEIIVELQPMLRKLPSEVRNGRDGLEGVDPAKPENLAQRLEEVKQLLQVSLTKTVEDPS